MNIDCLALYAVYIVLVCKYYTPIFYTLLTANTAMQWCVHYQYALHNFIPKKVYNPSGVIIVIEFY